jgi:hypothetical protein
VAPVRVKKTRQPGIVAFSGEVDAGSREENASSVFSSKKQDPEVLSDCHRIAHDLKWLATSIAARIEAVVVVVMMVVVAISGHDHHGPIPAPG